MMTVFEKTVDLKNTASKFLTVPLETDDFSKTSSSGNRFSIDV